MRRTLILLVATAILLVMIATSAFANRGVENACESPAPERIGGPTGAKTKSPLTPHIRALCVRNAAANPHKKLNDL